MEDTVGRNRSTTMDSARAESLFSDSWQIEWEESNRRFYRTLNESRIRQGVPPISHSSLQIEDQENQRSVFVKIQFEKYAISDEVLYQIFSGFGVIENIERFDSSMGFHSQIRFQHKASAIQAFSALNGRNIYDNCCQLELLLAKEIATRPSNSTEDAKRMEELMSQTKRGIEKLLAMSRPLPNPPTTSAIQEQAAPTNPKPEPPVATSSTTKTSNPVSTAIGVLGVEYEDQEIETSAPVSLPQESKNQSSSWSIDVKGETEALKVPPFEDPENQNPVPHTQLNQVTSNLCSAMIVDGPSKEVGELVDLLIELIEIRMANWRKDSIVCWKIPSAHKVFVKMPRRGVHLPMGLLVCSDHHSCEPIGFDFEDELKHSSITLSFDRGRVFDESSRYVSAANLEIGCWSFVFDPGILKGINPSVDCCHSCIAELILNTRSKSRPKRVRHGARTSPYDRGKESCVALHVQLGFWKPMVDLQIVVILVFDPGGVFATVICYIGLKLGLVLMLYWIKARPCAYWHTKLLQSILGKGIKCRRDVGLNRLLQMMIANAMQLAKCSLLSHYDCL